MNTLATRRQSFIARGLRRIYVRALIRWAQQDVDADTALRELLPKRIREHERAVANLRCELALLEGPR